MGNCNRGVREKSLFSSIYMSRFEGTSARGGAFWWPFCPSEEDTGDLIGGTHLNSEEKDQTQKKTREKKPHNWKGLYLRDDLRERPSGV